MSERLLLDFEECKAEINLTQAGHGSVALLQFLILFILPSFPLHLGKPNNAFW